MRTMIPLLLILAVLSAACSATPVPDLPTLAALPTETLAPVVAAVVPTIASLPTETPVPTVTVEASPTDEVRVTDVALATDEVVLVPTITPSSTQTSTPIVPTVTGTPTRTATPTETPTVTPTATRTPTLRPTVRPSLTITNTITPTPSPSYTPTTDAGLLGDLVSLSLRATILPPEQLYNPGTLTAVFYAGQAYAVTQAALTANPQLGGTPGAAVNCTTPPPGTIANAFAADPSLSALVGCPTGSAPTQTTIGLQIFERGSMVYVVGSPGSIYVLTPDGRFQRFDDTFVAGVDPDGGIDVPPPGYYEPRRSFGKVWRATARTALGWAITDETSALSSLLTFERGRVIAFPQRGESLLLADDPGGQTGTWRTVSGVF